MVSEGRVLLQKLGLDPARPVLFVAVPFSDACLGATIFDSYDIGDFFKAVQSVKNRLPNIQVLFKFRDYSHVGATREYLQELFSADLVIAGNEDLFALLCASDVVVCGNSTVLYEALLAQKPLVLYPWKEFDTYHLRMYILAAPLAHTVNELAAILVRIFENQAYRATLVNAERDFLRQYSFDGKSTMRTIQLLRDCAKLT
jgi:CDP-glycerol glycerophosphotransferase (TagB/SpsB family)